MWAHQARTEEYAVAAQLASKRNHYRPASEAPRRRPVKRC